MKKSACFLAALLLLTLLPVPALAAGEDFVIEDGVLVAYHGPGGDIVIPEGVHTIGAQAFYWNGRLRSVTIPGSVKAIGERAFFLGEGLVYVRLEEGVETIGPAAFGECIDLQTVTLPASLREIAPDAFSIDSGLLDAFSAPSGSAAAAFLQAQGCRVTEPTPFSTGFADVDPGDYCAFPVRWAVQRGIAKGTGPDTFSPDQPCTRGEIVTFLYRATAF